MVKELEIGHCRINFIYLFIGKFKSPEVLYDEILIGIYIMNCFHYECAIKRENNHVVVHTNNQCYF